MHPNDPIRGRMIEGYLNSLKRDSERLKARRNRRVPTPLWALALPRHARYSFYAMQRLPSRTRTTGHRGGREGRGATRWMIRDLWCSGILLRRQ